MTMPSPAMTCLLTGLIGGSLLWWAGGKTSAIVIFVAEAFGWAGLYFLTAAKGE